MELGDLQLAVMETVWKAGSATVTEVHEHLRASRPMAYTTALSTLRGLERKGYVAHEQDGKAHRFFPLISREEYMRRSLRHLVGRLFHGKPEALLSHLLGAHVVDARTVARVKRLIRGEPRR